MTVKYLVNWTHEDEVSGGSETRYRYLARAFPEATCVSVHTICGKYVHELDEQNCQRARQIVDDFLVANTTPNDVVIKDAGVGGTRSIPARTILFCGNPYASLMQAFPQSKSKRQWDQLVAAAVQDAGFAWKVIANSEFSKRDAMLSGIAVDYVLPNCVDIFDFFPRNISRDSILHLGGNTEVKGTVRARQLLRRAKLSQHAVFITKKHQYSSEQMRGLYQQARVLLVTSPVEGNSNAVLEALACGAAVCTTPAGYFADHDLQNAGAVLRDKGAAATLRSVWESFDHLRPREFILHNGLDYGDWKKRLKELVFA